MSLLSRAACVLWVSLVPAGVALGQTVPFETITTLSSDADPVEREFSVAQSGGGAHRLTLTDLGALLMVPGPAPLESVQVLVTRGDEVIATLDGTDASQSPSAVDTIDFEATPGTYAVHVVGKPGTNAGSGPFSVRIENVASSQAVLTFGDSLSPPETVQEGVRTYQVEVDVPADGAYELKLADFNFPQALETAGVFLFQNGASSVTACLSLPEIPGVCPASTTVNLTAGQYQLVAAGATPVAGSEGGLFAVHVRAASGGTLLHSRAVELGGVRRVSPAVELDAGAHTLSLTDLQFPAALAAQSAIATHAAETAARVDATTPEATFTVASNDAAHDVFVFASPDVTEGAGVYEIEVRRGTTPVLNSIEAIGGGQSGSPVVHTFRGDVGTAGSYRARLVDFEFPGKLGAARVAVVQNGAIVAETGAAGSLPTLNLDLPNLVSGPVTAISIVRPGVAGGTVQQSGGTFALELVSTQGNQTVLDATRGIGALIDVRKITFTQSGRYDLTLTDLDFPEAFQDLMAVVSQGTQKLGTVIVGSGGTNPDGGSEKLLDFNASAGTYSLTILAQPTETHRAAAYAISFERAPPGPTVTLTSDVPNVITGTTARLTWTSQNATSCTASSSPNGAWSGAKALSGNENSAALTAATTFTLRCTGADERVAEASVNVTVSAASSSGGGGGGGSFGWLALLGVAALTLRRALGRARVSQSVFL